LKAAPEILAYSYDVQEEVETESRYSVYLKRQNDAIADYNSAFDLELPVGASFADAPGLSNEIRQRLRTADPRTLAHANRLEGMTPAALTILAGYVRRPAHV
jgi:tRNA uridine 5-carboxymethylaminomethyl modification enzyme